MEDQRSLGSGRFDYAPPVRPPAMPAHAGQSGASQVFADSARSRNTRLFGTAILSVCVLSLAVYWSLAPRDSKRGEQSIVAAAMQSADGNATADIPISDLAAAAEMTTADIAMIGPAVAGQLIAQYQTLKESGLYTPEVAESVARELGENVIAPVPYKHYSAKDIKTAGDNSYESMLNYRAKLKDALLPMTKIEDLEISVFATYMETKDPAKLAQLHDIAAAYAASIKAASGIATPPEATQLHASILNAMGQFGVTIAALGDNAEDPITTIALLRTYNEAENAMITSFNNLAKYFANHPQP